MTKYQIQFNKNTLTFPSPIWLREFLVKHRGIRQAHTIMSIVESGNVYQDKEIKIITIKEM